MALKARKSSKLEAQLFPQLIWGLKTFYSALKNLDYQRKRDVPRGKKKKGRCNLNPYFLCSACTDFKLCCRFALL